MLLRQFFLFSEFAMVTLKPQLSQVISPSAENVQFMEFLDISVIIVVKASNSWRQLVIVIDTSESAKMSVQ